VKNPSILHERTKIRAAAAALLATFCTGSTTTTRAG
jgi:hypothetical protein